MWSPLDSLWGPQLPEEFDLTLCFEQSMFAIVPGGIITLALPFYFRTALTAARQVQSGFLLWLKMAVGLCLLAVQTTNLVLWHSASLFRSDVASAASSMSLLASISIVTILYIAHTYSLQPSAFLSVFLSITALFDITMTRSYFRRDGLGIIGALQISVVVLKFAMVILEEVPKRTLFRSEQLRSSTSAERASGFWNRIFLFWLSPLMLFGFRRDITMEDLPDVSQDFNSIRLFQQFSLRWNQANQGSKYKLAWVLFMTVRKEAAQIILPRLLFLALNFAQPFLLFRVTAAVKHDEDSDTAHGLIGATALIFGGIAVTRASYEHINYQMLTSVRGTLVVSIYDKLQRLDATELSKSAAITLMTADTAAVEDILQLLYDVWASAIQVALGIWSLSLFVGSACFLMLIPGIISFFASRFIGKRMSAARTAWNHEMEKRVAATSNILAQIKEVKATGLSKEISEYLQRKRELEIKASLQDRAARLWLIGFALVSHTMSPAIVLAGAYFWTRASDKLSVSEIFTILAIVGISASPYMMLLDSFMHWSGGIASLERIRNYLCLEEVQDTREDDVALPHADDSPGEKSSSEPDTPFAVQFDAVAFTSRVMGPILREVTLRIPWGALAMFWGPINCGKSTLLKCILGEVTPNSGTVTVGRRRVAYCSQECWIQNGTLQSTVIGILPFIYARYHAVIVACGLDVDIAAMPAGDQTMTGTDGRNLSGGQKQRLSLARAVYTQEKIMVLDDVLSAVDPELATDIFTRLFGPEGLVRQWNCTVIMTTNQLHFLDDANYVFQMSRNGRVQRQENVRDSDGDSIPGSSSSDSDDEMVSQRRAAAAAAAEPPELPSVNPSEDTEVPNTRHRGRGGDWSLYGYFLGSAGALKVIVWACSIAVAALIERMPMIFLRIWHTKDPDNPYYFIGYVAFSVANIICNPLTIGFYFYYLVPKSSETLHWRITRTVLLASPPFLGQTDSGILLNRFSQDMSVTSQQLPISFVQFVFMFSTIIVDVGIIAAGSPYTAPIMLFLFVVLFAVQFFYLRTSRQLRLLELESTSSLMTHVTETSTGIEHVRSFGWQREFKVHLHNVLHRSQRPLYILFCCQRWLRLSLDCTAAAASVLLVSLSLSLPSSTSDGAVGLALLSLIGFTGAASFLIRSWTTVETGLGAIARIRSFCTETPQETDSLPEPEESDDWPLDGQIDFNGVTAYYHTDNGLRRTALAGITLTIRAGEKVVITGRSGSGKSSMLSAILRMVDFRGAISIDDRDTTTMPREQLRSRITTLTQDGIELKESVRFNIFPFRQPSPSDNLIIATLQSLGLWEHIRRHGGLDCAYVDMRFSRSQKQLLFLARAILHQRIMSTSIVLIDEATSAMDKDASQMLAALLTGAFAACTVLQIAHRSPSLDNFDVSIRLEHGTLGKLRRKHSDGTWPADD